MKYPTILFALLLALTLLLSACGAQEEPQPPEDAEPEPFTLSVSLPGQADTLDPLRSTAQGTETILHHLFENLMRWGCAPPPGSGAPIRWRPSRPGGTPCSSTSMRT